MWLNKLLAETCVFLDVRDDLGYGYDFFSGNFRSVVYRLSKGVMFGFNEFISLSFGKQCARLNLT